MSDKNLRELRIDRNEDDNNLNNNQKSPPVTREEDNKHIFYPKKI